MHVEYSLADWSEQPFVVWRNAMVYCTHDKLHFFRPYTTPVDSLLHLTCNLDLCSRSLLTRSIIIQINKIFLQCGTLVQNMKPVCQRAFSRYMIFLFFETFDLDLWPWPFVKVTVNSHYSLLQCCTFQIMKYEVK